MLTNAVKSKYQLKQNDNAYVCWPDGRITLEQVEGFYCYGMKIKNGGTVPFYARSFYSCGYNSDLRVIVANKKWHIAVAKIIDNIRQVWYRLNLV